MSTFVSPPPKPRPCTWRLLFGGKALEITVERKAGKRIKPVVTLYLVERKAADLVELVQDGGEVYTVSRFNCTCRDSQFNGGKGVVCKHRTACRESGLLGEIASEVAT